MTNNTHILIVDDDREIRELLGKFLQDHGLNATPVEDGNAMRQAMSIQTFDLIILDLMLPGDDGLALCRELRQTSELPIIMLTAMGEDVDRILGLEMGADDYIAKPFNPRELLARIRAILRRSHKPTPSQHALHTSTQSKYYFDKWVLNKTSRQLISPDQLDVSLSGGEFDLLLALVEHPQHVLSRDQLLDLTKNREAGPFDRSIDIQISRLRHKLEANPKKPKIIKTVRGGGYVLASNIRKEP